jgi:hypothetical protein
MEPYYQGLCFLPVQLFLWGIRLYLGFPVERSLRFIALLYKERGLACSLIDQSCLLVVDYCYPFILIVLVVIYIGIQPLVEVLVNNLYLAIGLGMVGR